MTRCHLVCISCSKFPGLRCSLWPLSPLHVCVILWTVYVAERQGCKLKGWPVSVYLHPLSSERWGLMSPGSASASGHSLPVLTFALECWDYQQCCLCSAKLSIRLQAGLLWELRVGLNSTHSFLSALCQSLESCSDPLRISLFLWLAKSGISCQDVWPESLESVTTLSSGIRMDFLQTAKQSWHTCTKMSFCRAYGTTLWSICLACTRPWMPSPALKISDDKEINITETCEMSIHGIINRTQPHSATL